MIFLNQSWIFEDPADSFFSTYRAEFCPIRGIDFRRIIGQLFVFGWACAFWPGRL
jgi:hypothetical protein